MDVGPEILLAEYVTQKTAACVIKPDGEGFVVYVSNPQDYSEEELSEIAGCPVKLEVLANALD